MVRFELSSPHGSTGPVHTVLPLRSAWGASYLAEPIGVQDPFVVSVQLPNFHVHGVFRLFVSLVLSSPEDRQNIMCTERGTSRK